MNNGTKIPLSISDITEKEIQAVIGVLRSKILSLGPKLIEFEEKFAEYIGTRFAVAVNSGTSGLHLAVRSLGIGENDAVITTPFSFVASANCVLYERALPIFVDIEPRAFNIDPAKIREYIHDKCDKSIRTGRPIDRKTGREIKALLPVHIFGHPCQMEEITKIARENNLFIIEDACEALGAECGGKKAGSFGDAAVFGFFPNKQITTGEGGMILTDDEKIASLCRSMRNQGRDSTANWLSHDKLGYNYRISDINCALGLVQLGRIDEMLEKRDQLARKYSALLESHVTVPPILNGVRRSWFVYVVSLPEDLSGKDRNAILIELRNRGIEAKNYFPPIHLQPFYKESFGYTEGRFPNCEDVSKRTIALPFYNRIEEDQVLYVAESLSSILGDPVLFHKRLEIDIFSVAKNPPDLP